MHSGGGGGGGGFSIVQGKRVDNMRVAGVHGVDVKDDAVLLNSL